MDNRFITLLKKEIKMKEIKYIKADATDPKGEGKKLLIHCCNDIGGWGAGFVTALSKRWKEPEEKYRLWYKSGKNFELGNIQPVKVEKDIAVVNMIGQEGVGYKNGVPPIRYKAVESCLLKVADLALKYNASIHCPYLMCCDLAGGEWETIENMLIEAFSVLDIDVTVYDLFGKRK
jgi:hypothetical protein